MTQASLRSAKLRGILLLVASVSCFGVVDGISKMLVVSQSFGQIVLARYIFALLLLLAAVTPSRWRSLYRTRLPGLQIARGITPVIVGGAMVFAVKYLPLAEATAVLFAGPFFVVALSGWLLGERVGLSSWIGVAVGFLAVLVVARPGFAELSRYTIYPAIAALFYAALQLLSRRLGQAGEDPGTTLAWTLTVGTVIAIPLAIAGWMPLSGEAWLLSLALGATFGAGQYFMAKAFALAPANVLTPFTYFQILSAVIFGIVVFHDIPDTWTITGIILIIAAGAYVFSRNREGET